MRFFRRLLSFIFRNLFLNVHYLFRRVAGKWVSSEYVSTPRVSICVPLFNRGTMLRHLVENLKRIEHWEKNVQLLIADYGSTDVESIETLVRSQLSIPFTLLPLHGTFSKVDALQKMIEHESVMENEIVFICDVDLFLPDNIFSSIRRFTQLGAAFFSPVLSFQRQDGTIQYPWYDHRGTGFLCFYKSDFLALGGFRDSGFEHKTTWGGEDDYLYFSFRDKLGLRPVRHLHPEIFSRWHPRDEGQWFDNRKKRAWD
ncbi:MAG: hypothetical protein H6617_11655 [Bdellovibrionaceae bacterium]|nr:hypothetical protein [Bdellovibrionales bacterium]MCB9255328.1 hypothetical protein [Pseudobdellovibrionaceae bacterium]